MKQLTVLSLMVALAANSLAEEPKREFTPPSLATKTLNEAKMEGGFCKRKVEIKNTSGSEFFVYGYSKEFVFIDFVIKDPSTGSWVEYPRLYCGTGAGSHRIGPGEAFTAEIHLPKEKAGSVVKVRFRAYSDGTLNKQVFAHSGPISMDAVGE